MCSSWLTWPYVKSTCSILHLAWHWIHSIAKPLRVDQALTFWNNFVCTVKLHSLVFLESSFPGSVNYKDDIYETIKSILWNMKWWNHFVTDQIFSSDPVILFGDFSGRGLMKWRDGVETVMQVEKELCASSAWCSFAVVWPTVFKDLSTPLSPFPRQINMVLSLGSSTWPFSYLAQSWATTSHTLAWEQCLASTSWAPPVCPHPRGKCF